MLQTILLTIHIMVSIALTGVVLLQRSEGGALGMGGGGSSFMTARGAGDLLTRTTWILATLFVVLSMTLTLMAGHARGSGSITDRLKIDAIDLDALKRDAPAADQQPGAPPVTAPATPAGPAPLEAPKPQVRTAAPDAAGSAPAPSPAPKP